MTAAIPRERKAVRHPKRGKAHRRNEDAYTSTLFPGSTVCARFARDMTELVDVETTDPADRCVNCWAGTPWRRP